LPKFYTVEEWSALPNEMGLYLKALSGSSILRQKIVPCRGGYLDNLIDGPEGVQAFIDMRQAIDGY